MTTTRQQATAAATAAGFTLDPETMLWSSATVKSARMSYSADLSRAWLQPTAVDGILPQPIELVTP